MLFFKKVAEEFSLFIFLQSISLSLSFPLLLSSTIIANRCEVEKSHIYTAITMQKSHLKKFYFPF